jgi:cell division protein FtsB
MLFGPGAYELIRMDLRQRQLDWQLRRLQEQEAALAREDLRLRSDPVYVEGLIRTTFKYAKPGEYVIPLERAAPTLPTARPAGAETSR